MKNKKLFAILTLVCFMFTLMPVAAFATEGVEETATVAETEEAVTTAEGTGDGVINTAEKLQVAIDAAEGTTTITLGGDITGNVTITQKEGLHLTLDGANHTFTGVLTLSGQSSQLDGQSTTIKKINFEGTDKDKACIYVPDKNQRYTNHVTIEKCTFKDTENAKNNRCPD